MVHKTRRSQLLFSMALLPLLVVGVRHSAHIATNENITAKIQFISDKQSRHFEPAASQVFDRTIDTDRKLRSHNIVTQVTFGNVKRDPVLFP